MLGCSTDYSFLLEFFLGDGLSIAANADPIAS
jgi:hypothetical protein